MRYSPVLSGLVLVAAVLGCTNSVAPGMSQLAANLRKAPTSVQVGAATVSLSAYLWRDFMPGVGPSNTSLRGSFSIRTQDPAIHPPVTFDKLWVINGHAVWIAKLEHNPVADPAPGTILMMARNGPEWATGITVDVVAQVGLSDGSKQLVRTSTLIQRSD